MSFVVPVRVNFVVLFLMVTATPGTTAPVESVTTPFTAVRPGRTRAARHTYKKVAARRTCLPLDMNVSFGLCSFAITANL